MKKKYQIITRQTPKKLEEAVEDAIKDGYTPIGGVSVALIVVDSKDEVVFAQSLLLQS